MASKFKKGDRVRVTHESYGYINNNREGVVISTRGDTTWSIRVRFTDTKAYSLEDIFAEDQLVKLQKTQKPSKATQAYKGNGKHDWELVAAANPLTVNRSFYRLRVPGGWLYGPSSGDAVRVPMPAVVRERSHKV